MGHGGKREGAGKKKGVPNKDRRDFLALIDRIAKPEELIAKMQELTQGVLVQKETKDGPVVYEKPPDAFAISYLLDQRFGKARQSIEVEGNAIGLYERLIRGNGAAAGVDGKVKK